MGLISTATLMGSAVAAIAVGMVASRFTHRRMLTLAAALMAATGIGFAGLSTWWPLLVVAFFGTLNSSSGDISLFLPLEQARLAEAATGDARTALFARYSLIGAVSAALGSFAAAPLEAIFGSKGQTNNGMFKIVIAKPSSMHGVKLGSEMGVNTWAAFADSHGEAVIDGDFAMRESELQAVLKSMRASGINIVAIHEHMTGEAPRTLFLHYWGKGKAVDLAKGVKTALNAQAAVAH